MTLYIQKWLFSRTLNSRLTMFAHMISWYMQTLQNKYQLATQIANDVSLHITYYIGHQHDILYTHIRMYVHVHTCTCTCNVILCNSFHSVTIFCHYITENRPFCYHTLIRNRNAISCREFGWWFCGSTTVRFSAVIRGKDQSTDQPLLQFRTAAARLAGGKHG